MKTTVKTGISPVSDQALDPTCFIHSSARIILKAMRNVIPELLEFTYNTENKACDQYFNQNIFLENVKLENIITDTLCDSVQYNYLVLFMFIYFIMYSTPHFFDTYIIQVQTFNDFIDIYINKTPTINCNLFNGYYNKDAYCDHIQFLFNSYHANKSLISYTSVTCFDIPARFIHSGTFLNYIKTVLANKLYLMVSYALGDIQGDYLTHFTKMTCFDDQPEFVDYENMIITDKVTHSKILNPMLSLHEMVIIGYKNDINDEYNRNPTIIIKNSWNKSWCNNGIFFISYSELLKRIDLTINFIIPSNINFDISKSYTDFVNISEIPKEEIPIHLLQYDITENNINTEALTRNIKNNTVMMNRQIDNVDHIKLFLQLENLHYTKQLILIEKHDKILHFYKDIDKLYNELIKFKLETKHILHHQFMIEPKIISTQEEIDKLTEEMVDVDIQIAHYFSSPGANPGKKQYEFINSDLRKSELALIEVIAFKKNQLRVFLERYNKDKIDYIQFPIKINENLVKIQTYYDLILPDLKLFNDIYKKNLELNIISKLKVTLETRLSIIAIKHVTNEAEIALLNQNIKLLEDEYGNITNANSPRLNAQKKNIESEIEVLTVKLSEYYSPSFPNKLYTVLGQTTINTLIYKKKAEQDAIVYEIDALEKKINNITKYNTPMRISSRSFSKHVGTVTRKTKSRQTKSKSPGKSKSISPIKSKSRKIKSI